MKKIFLVDKFPYLLTLLFVLCGWSANRIITKYTSSPSIEYSEVHTPAQDGKSYLYKIFLHNLSDKEKFERLDFHLTSRQAKILEANIYSEPPASKEFERYFDTDYADYTIYQFQPGWKYVLYAKLDSGEKPEFWFKSEKPVKLTGSSFGTFLVRNEISLMFILLGIWILLIYMYLAFVSKNPV